MLRALRSVTSHGKTYYKWRFIFRFSNLNHPTTQKETMKCETSWLERSIWEHALIGVSFEPSKHLGRNHDLPFLLRCGSHKFNITAAKHIMQITALSRLKLPSLNRLAGNGQRRGLSVYDIFRYTLSIDRCAFLGYIYIYLIFIFTYSIMLEWIEGIVSFNFSCYICICFNA